MKPLSYICRPISAKIEVARLLALLVVDFLLVQREIHTGVMVWCNLLFASCKLVCMKKLLLTENRMAYSKASITMM